MSRWAGIAAMAAVLAFILLFARLNGSERVTLDLGIWTLYRVPVMYVAFVSLLFGMVVMMLAGLHSDLKVRRYLRSRLAEESGDQARERADVLQRDLFRPEVVPDVIAYEPDVAASEPDVIAPQPDFTPAPDATPAPDVTPESEPSTEGLKPHP